MPPDSGAFPQVSQGLTVTVERDTGRCKDIRINGLPFDPRRTYKIATNSYLAHGGDGYRMFLKADDAYDTSVPQTETVIAYIKHIGGRIRPALKGRIRLDSLLEINDAPSKSKKWVALRLGGEDFLNLGHDLSDIVGGNIGKPDLLRVDHDIGASSAEAHAAAVGYPNLPFPTSVVDLLFQGCSNKRAFTVGTGFSGSASVVGADEDMAYVRCFFDRVHGHAPIDVIRFAHK
jgi:hypothetical protein